LTAFPSVLSNAIRYTADERIRQITVSIEAYDSIPPPPPGCKRVATEKDLTLPENGSLIVIGVTDSGKGLNPQEMQLVSHHAFNNAAISSLSLGSSSNDSAKLIPRREVF
jgi:hypothetical protein